MLEGRMSVQLFERDTDSLQSRERGEAETQVLAVVVSHGDKMVQISLDDERDKWEIEVVGGSTINHA